MRRLRRVARRHAALQWRGGVSSGQRRPGWRMRSSPPRRAFSFDEVEGRQCVGCPGSAKGAEGAPARRQGRTPAPAIRIVSARLVASVLSLHDREAGCRNCLCRPRLRAGRAGIIPAARAAQSEDQCLNEGKKGRWEQQINRPGTPNGFAGCRECKRLPPAPNEDRLPFLGTFHDWPGVAGCTVSAAG